MPLLHAARPPAARAARPRSNAAVNALRGTGAVLSVVAALIGALGWLYELKQLGWLTDGPRINDSLPLLQLARVDGQPLLRVVVAWLLAGLVTGVVLRWIGPLRRTALVAGVGLPLLLVDSQASYALARNLRFSAIVWTRGPGLGPWLEAALFVLACALPGSLVRRHGGAPASSATGVADLSLRGG